MADEEDIISREDLNSNKNIFMEQQLYAMKIADIYNTEVKKKLTERKKVKTIFPSAETLYNKDVVKEMDPCKHKPKVKKFEEDIKKNKINTIIEKKVEPISNENTSTSSKDDTNDLKNLDQVFKAINNLFTDRKKSRFEFVNRKTEEGVEIPKFIKDLIFKKVSRHKLTKNIKHSEDILYSDNNLEAEYQNNNPWAQFIVENKIVNDDWEFIQDFDYINSMILQKTIK
jgi:hypothetical protein